MTPTEEEIIYRSIEAITVWGAGYVLRIIHKIIENVNSIPKMRQDIQECYKRLRALEEEK